VADPINYTIEIKYLDFSDKTRNPLNGKARTNRLIKGQVKYKFNFGSLVSEIFKISTSGKMYLNIPQRQRSEQACYEDSFKSSYSTVATPSLKNTLCVVSYAGFIEFLNDQLIFQYS